MFYEIRPSSKTAVITADGIRLSYEELAADVALVGQQLEQRRLTFCLCENSPASLVGYLACLNSKTVPLLVDKAIDSHLLEDLLRCYQPNYLYVPAEMADRFPGYAEKAAYRN